MQSSKSVTIVAWATVLLAVACPAVIDIVAPCVYSTVGAARLTVSVALPFFAGNR